MEIKGDRARMAAPKIAQNRQKIGDYLKARVADLRFSDLDAIFLPALIHHDPDTVKLSRVFEEDKTRSWLLGSCLPAFVRYIWKDGADWFVMDQYMKAIEEFMKNETTE
jgi:hypothetical protein